MILTESRLPKKVDYQSQKKTKTTNTLYFVDKQGIPLEISNPVSGNYHILSNYKWRFEEVISVLKESNILSERLFVNFDEKRYKGYYSIGRTKYWAEWFSLGFE